MLIKKIGTVIVFNCLTFFVHGQYQVFIDLTHIVDDQLPVEISVPPIQSDTVEFHMPKVVPGTYSISDFGRFVVDFSAKNNKSETLQTEKLDINRWVIYGAKQLDKITYKVHDTFDENELYKENYIFEPAGTQIDATRQVFVLNTFGIVGYLKGKEFETFDLTVKKPAELYGSSALENINRTTSEEIFRAENYHFLADGPIMFCKPDTASLQIANAKVLVSVYSPNNKLSAAEVMSTVESTMKAQAAYLGGNLPVDRYAYLIYLLDDSSLSGSMGALEHSYSSVYALPEANAKQIAQTVRDVAAHEFFHIVTPLNIHSEEIHYFNFIEPKMSQHLWLYEGVTEYSSMHVQVKHGLYGKEKFLEELKEKVAVADQFGDDLAFTEMSRRILEPEYEPYYTNVYYKGALIGMCLDLYLLKYSDGKTDLQGLLRLLSEKYGKNQPFKDDELFSEITKLTYPEVGQFFTTYVAGTVPLPLDTCLAWAGIEKEKSKKIKKTTLGNISLSLGQDQKIVVADVSSMNDFGRSMGFLAGDVILSVNKMKVNPDSFGKMIEKLDKEKEGKKIQIVVLREQDGTMKEKVLRGNITKIEVEVPGQFRFMTNPSPDQLKIQKAWLTTEIQ